MTIIGEKYIQTAKQGIEEMARIGMIVCLLIGMGSVAFTPAVVAQQDSVTMMEGKGRPLRGAIEKTTAESISITVREGDKEVMPWNIKRIRYDGETAELSRAKASYFDERYSNSLQLLNELTDTYDRKVIMQDVEFFKAMSAAHVAMEGGNVTPSQAVTGLQQFADANADSFRLHPVIEMIGDLQAALGKFDLAREQYKITANSAWPEISMNSKLKYGRALLLTGEYDKAIAAFEDVEDIDSGEEFAPQIKTIAKCLRAKAMGQNGQATEGLALASNVLQTMTGQDNAILANAYNAKGVCYLKEGNAKKALVEFLHTELLFTMDAESHAEALYYLHGLWTQLERKDRASKVRQKMSDRYRNTWWMNQLNN